MQKCLVVSRVSEEGIRFTQNVIKKLSLSYDRRKGNLIRIRASAQLSTMTGVFK